MGTTGRTSSAAEFAERQQEQQLAKRAEQLGVTIGPNTPAEDAQRCMFHLEALARGEERRASR